MFPKGRQGFGLIHVQGLDIKREIQRNKAFKRSHSILQQNRVSSEDLGHASSFVNGFVSGVLNHCLGRLSAVHCECWSTHVRWHFFVSFCAVGKGRGNNAIAISLQQG